MGFEVRVGSHLLVKFDHLKRLDFEQCVLTVVDFTIVKPTIVVSRLYHRKFALRVGTGRVGTTLTRLLSRQPYF